MRFHLRPAAFDVTESIAKPLAIAVFFVFLALLWTFPLQHVIAYPFIFLFFGAIMCSAWFGGFTGGMLAVIFSSVCVDFFFLPPLYSFTVGKEFRGFETAFIVCAIAITAVSAARKRSETAIRVAKDELEVRVLERTAELQRSNEELKEREHHLRLLTEAIPQQIWRTDINGEIEYGNRNLLEYTGKKEEELGGERFFEIFHSDDAATVRTAWEQARLSLSGFEAKARVMGADGRYRWFLIRGKPQLAPDGTIARWYGVHVDVEQQEQAQQELLIAQDRLSKLTRTLSMAEMAASIAHQLKQPLTALMTDAHACRRWLQVNPPNIERATVTADRIVRETTRASAVVDRVRALFSRTNYRRELTDINALIRDLTRLLREEANRRGIAIRLMLSDVVPAIQTDPIQIQQVILNLVMNAMEATADTAARREVSVSSEVHSEHEVRVTVTDYGAGIAEPLRERMFEPFFTTKPSGTGMGLAICRSIIEEHEGKIWAESREGKTEIHFTLKVVQA